MRLALDHHYSPLIAAQLRDAGHDAVTAAERGWAHVGDEELLASCENEGRALLTNNVADFAVIARDWAAQARRHHGLVFTSDVSMPRHRGTIGTYVTALAGLLGSHPSDDALADRVHWL